MRQAVIDLGTNTFHLLIVDLAEFQASGSVLYKERIYVFLGENGSNLLGQKAMKRGMDAMVHFNEIISEYNVEYVKAVGTEGLRSAKNSIDFLAKIKNTTGIDVEIISGDQEAILIYQGVSLLCKTLNRYLIMDIGGGSVEFILVDNHNLKWKQSFKVGISVLYSKFHQVEPIEKSSLLMMHDYLSIELKELFNAVGSEQVSLVGASGTFDVLSQDIKKNKLYSFDINILQNLHDELVNLNEEERIQSALIPKPRSKYIVVAFYLILFIYDKLNISDTFISPYSMKEGAVSKQ